MESIRGQTEKDKRRSQIVVTENKRTYRGFNTLKKEVFVYRIDGGVLSSRTHRKCDCAVCIREDDAVILIEFKGRHYGEAIEQLIATIVALEVQLKGRAVVGRVIVREVPPMVPTRRVAALKKLLARYCNSTCKLIDFDHGSGQFVETI